MGGTRRRDFDEAPAVTATGDGLFGTGSDLAWDADPREIDTHHDPALQRQARNPRARGVVTDAETPAPSARLDRTCP